MAILSSSPEVYFLNTEDSSKRQVLPEPLPIPQHCPLQFLFTQKGPDTKELATGAQMLKLYGDDSFNKRSKYFNHATIFAKGFSSKGNVMMVKRLIPEDAGPKSNMVLYIDIATADVPNYLRNSDGSLVWDNDTSSYKTDSVNPTIEGYKIKIIKDYVNTEELTLGSASSKTGTMKNKDGTDSTMYPIFDIKAKYKGEYYNNIGITLTTYTKDILPIQIISESKTFPYGLSVVSREDVTKSPVVTKTKYGENTVMVTLKPNVTNPITDSEFGITDILPEMWKNELDGNPKVQLMYSDFEEVHLYTEYIETVLTMLATKEKEYITTTTETFEDGLEGNRLSWYDYSSNEDDTILDSELYLFNMLTLKSLSGVNYQSVIISTDTPTLTGNLSEVQISSNTPLWLNGGSDGTINDGVFNELVKKEMAKYLDPNSEVMDLAVNNESFLYDSGFPLEYKKELVNFIAVRPNTVVMLSTYDASLNKPMSLSDERAVASAIISKLKMVPESTYFGTGVMRACIVQQSGVDKLREYKSRIPLLFDYAMKASELMGAGNGYWKRNSYFDKQPGNIVRDIIDVKPDFLPANVKPILWDVGLIWGQKRDRNEVFYPASQTVYDNDTSVLNNFFMVSAIAYLNTIAYKVWQRFTGDTEYTPAIFKQKVETYMLKLIDNGGIYLNKFDIVPEVYFTETDSQRGYSWHLKIKVSGNNMKTVMTTHVEAFRKEA